MYCVKRFLHVCSVEPAHCVVIINGTVVIMFVVIIISSYFSITCCLVIPVYTEVTVS
jgi:hypothetical protein